MTWKLRSEDLKHTSNDTKKGASNQPRNTTWKLSSTYLKHTSNDHDKVESVAAATKKTAAMKSTAQSNFKNYW